MPPMGVGYARVSQQDQRLEPQRDAPLANRHERVFEEKVFSRDTDSQALREAFDWCREGVILMVATVDRVGRPLC
jgi:DNA invertase Pin-like site-specific DNA recombinase